MTILKVESRMERIEGHDQHVLNTFYHELCSGLEGREGVVLFFRSPSDSERFECMCLPLRRSPARAIVQCQVVPKHVSAALALLLNEKKQSDTKIAFLMLPRFCELVHLRDPSLKIFVKYLSCITAEFGVEYAKQTLLLGSAGDSISEVAVIDVVAKEIAEDLLYWAVKHTAILICKSKNGSQ